MNGRPLRPSADPDWQKRAVCYLETSATPELWTPDLQPRGVVRLELERMCGRCPVLRRCAAHAVGTEAEAGFYAGVWVPERQYEKWSAAIEQLREIAGLVSERPALGVSA